MSKKYKIRNYAPDQDAVTITIGDIVVAISNVPDGVLITVTDNTRTDQDPDFTILGQEDEYSEGF